MPDGKATQRDIAMKGAGYYSKATTGAKDVIDAAAHLVLEAVARMDPPDDGSVFTFADMGTADGGTSIGMVGQVLKDLRRRMPSRPIQMVYTDLPRNDFSQLFQIMHGLTDIPSYKDEIDDLYIFASATSFHEGIFPAGTLNLGFTATSSHYISSIPAKIPTHVHMTGAEGDARQAFIDQGRKDWESMLTNRARELVSGGRLVMCNFGIDEEGRFLGATGGVNMFDTFADIWREFRDAGTITADEFLNTNFVQHYRTVDEFTAPVTDETNQVYKAGLRLEHVETRVVKCPFAQAFAAHGDAERFAREYIPTLRSWSETVFVAGLNPDRPAEEVSEIVDRFYGTYQDRVAAAPEGHGMDYVHCYLILRKE